MSLQRRAGPERNHGDARFVTRARDEGHFLAGFGENYRIRARVDRYTLIGPVVLPDRE